MDESFMSIASFDEESFINEALKCTSPQSVSGNTSGCIATSNPPTIDISDLLTKPLEASVKIPSSKLTFNDTETPRNSVALKRSKKLKNFSRRCLSTDLNSDYSLNAEAKQLSFQEFRKSNVTSKRTLDDVFTIKSQNFLSSIENLHSPKILKRNQADFLNVDLTPEFDTDKKSKSKDFTAVIPKVPLKVNNNNQIVGGNIIGGVPLQKCYSENHASIMRAVQVSSSDSSLIGDFSKPYILPLLLNSKHQDLKSISCHVLADVIRGAYTNMIESFTIVDCRYPYEYDGGHIESAVNFYTQEHVLTNFVVNSTKEAEATSSLIKRNILIFHCEFSSERGPSLCRFLRNKDRVKNTRVYPNLYYPELYLLEGGYKEFFTHYSELCRPRAYMPMHAKEHEDDLRKFRSFVKSHSFDSKFTTHKRNLRL